MEGGLQPIKCVFDEKFTRPKKKYTVVSFSIFYSPQYMRHFYKAASKNITLRRQMQFLYNLTLNITNMDNGFIPEDWYFRIFYDKSLFSFYYNKKKPWEEFFETYRKHPRIQFVEFTCPDFLVSKNFHINLFGTITRLYPIFQVDDNLEMIIVFDADNFITEDYVKEIEKFKKTKFDYNTFCSRFELSFYKHERTSDCYLRTGMISTKVKLDPILWDFILTQVKVFSDKNFTVILENLQKRWEMLLPERKIKSYKEFEYGMDEIILNHYLRKLMKLEGYKLRKVRYRPMTVGMFSTMATYLKFDYKKPENRAKIDKLLKLYLKADFKEGKINENLDNMIQLVKDNTTYNSDYKEVYPYIKPARDNIDILESLWMSNTVTAFFKEVNEQDYNAAPFSDFFVSIDLPIYLQSYRPKKKKFQKKKK
jgi:hypothetical protein